MIIPDGVVSQSTESPSRSSLTFLWTRLMSHALLDSDSHEVVRQKRVIVATSIFTLVFAAGLLLFIVALPQWFGGSSLRLTVFAFLVLGMACLCVSTLHDVFHRKSTAVGSSGLSFAFVILPPAVYFIVGDRSMSMLTYQFVVLLLISLLNPPKYVRWACRTGSLTASFIEALIFFFDYNWFESRMTDELVAPIRFAFGFGSIVLPLLIAIVCLGISSSRLQEELERRAEAEQLMERLNRERDLTHRLLNNILPEDISVLLLEHLQQAVEDRRSSMEQSALMLASQASPLATGRSAQVPIVQPPPEYLASRAGSTTSCLTGNSGSAGPGLSIARDHSFAGVLFADIVGFTAISSGCTATDLVGSLNKIVSAIDRECRACRVEKIKTIGDAYMCCSLTTEDQVPDAAVVLPLIKLADAIHRIGPSRRLAGNPVQFRIGVAGGPLVSGVIGLLKFQFDIWGDTVNLASRMESTGVGGATQVPENVYKAIEHTGLAFDERGETVVKGKGTIRTYLRHAVTTANKPAENTALLEPMPEMVDLDVPSEDTDVVRELLNCSSQ